MLLRHVRSKFVPSPPHKVAATCSRCVNTRSTSVIPSCGASPLPDIQIPDVTFTEFVTARFDEFIARQGSDSTPAIVDGISGDARSWRQLRYDIDAVGTALAGLGLSSGDVLALVSPNHVDYFSCLHATAALGAAVNPVNPVLTPVELEALITGCNARMVVAHPDCLPAVEKALARCRGRLQHNDVPLIVFTDADSAADNFTLGPGRVSYDDLRWQGADADAAAPPPPPLPLHAADISPSTHVAALPYSSGTTGAPKGVMLTHRNLVANVLQCRDPEFRFYEGSHAPLSIISPLPMFHIYPYTVCLAALLRDGHQYITMKRFDLRAFCGLVERHRCERAFVVPPIVLQLAKGQEVDEFDLGSLRWLCSAAAPLSAELETAVTDRLGVNVKQCWGMSELSPIGTFTPDDGLKPGAGSIGVAVANTEWKLLALGDDSTDNDSVSFGSAKLAAPGARGELCIRGPQVMAGYLDAPDKTSECLSDDGWLRTGDVAVADKDGYLYIVDRIKELVKYKGHQVAPAELEALLLSHPSVADAAVIGVPNEAAGELPRAYIVLKPDNERQPGDTDKSAAEAVRQFVDGQVNPYMRLRGGVVVMDEIPKSASGKLLRRVLVDHAKANP